MKRNLILIGAADSIGVPYTKDNYNHQGFFEMIEKELYKEYNIISINCFHMSTNNDNKYINTLISNNISLLNIKNTQNQMLKKCKYSGIYPYLELPKKFLNHYKPSDNDEKIVTKNYIKNNDTIFIYSAFVNDLLKSKKLSLFKILRPGKIKKELRKINIDNILYDLEENIKKLITMNFRIKIFIIGLFIPTKIPYIRRNLKDFIFSVNTAFKKISEKYDNVILINNDNLIEEDFNNIDFHPNKKGHIKIYHNFMEEYKKKQKICQFTEHLYSNSNKSVVDVRHE